MQLARLKTVYTPEWTQLQSSLCALVGLSGWASSISAQPMNRSILWRNSEARTTTLTAVGVSTVDHVEAASQAAVQTTAQIGGLNNKILAAYANWALLARPPSILVDAQLESQLTARFGSEAEPMESLIGRGGADQSARRPLVPTPPLGSTIELAQS